MIMNERKYSEITSLNELGVVLGELNDAVVWQEKVVRQRVGALIGSLRGVIPIISSGVGAVLGGTLFQSAVKGMRFGRKLVSMIHQMVHR